MSKIKYLSVKSKKKLLSFNVYYAPKSFGGATVVAEEINLRLKNNFNWDITVITTFQDKTYYPYHLKKYRIKDVNIIAINLPEHSSYELIYRNENIADILANIIKSIKPDFAHIHSIQHIGSSFINALHANRIKTVLTIHDCWWICERQFMINKAGRYCFQKKIDPMACMYCVDEISRFEKRSEYLNEVLSKIDLFLFPSDFHRQVHIDNGLDPKKCLTNKNGIMMPSVNYKKAQSKVIRFGFTGGPGKIKGYELILDAFSKVALNNYELVVVDGAKNLGKSWSHAFKNAKIEGKIRIMPPYTQNTMDDFYKHIDVLLFPSQWKESFGLTVREALVRDIWVISTNGGGTTEDLVEGENSHIIPISDNADYLLEAILECFDKNFKTYINRYKEAITTYDDQAEELNEILESILSNNESISHEF